MRYFDDDFAFLVQNLFLILLNLPAVIPEIPSPFWNNEGVISSTGQTHIPIFSLFFHVSGDEEEHVINLKRNVE